MAIHDPITALATAASLPDPPVLTGAKRFPNDLATGLARRVESGDRGGWRFSRLPAHTPRPLPAVTARDAPGERPLVVRPRPSCLTPPRPPFIPDSPAPR